MRKVQESEKWIMEKKYKKTSCSYRNSLEIKRAKFSPMQLGQRQILPWAFPPVCTAQWEVFVVQGGAIWSHLEKGAFPWITFWGGYKDRAWQGFPLATAQEQPQSMSAQRKVESLT